MTKGGPLSGLQQNVVDQAGGADYGGDGYQRWTCELGRGVEGGGIDDLEVVQTDGGFLRQDFLGGFD